MEYLFIFMKWKREDLLKLILQIPCSPLHVTTFSTIKKEYRMYSPALLITTFDSYLFYSLYSVLSCFLYTIYTKCNLKVFLTILNYHTQIKIEDANGSIFSSQWTFTLCSSWANPFLVAWPGPVRFQLHCRELFTVCEETATTIPCKTYKNLML